MVVGFCCTDASAFGLVPVTTERQTAETVAVNEIQKFVLSCDPIATWDAFTEISSYIELYDLEDNINGYIFHLTTDDEPSGFIQVGKFDGNYVVMNLGFDGEDYLTKMLHSNGIEETTLANSKAYFLGNMNYYVYHNEELVDLLNKEMCNVSAGSLMNAYETYIEVVSNDISSSNVMSTLSTSATGTTVTVGNIVSNRLVSMYYFKRQGYSNHCVPTAATNLVLYWSMCRGKSGLGTDPDEIFNYFYTRMHTNNNSDGESGTEDTAIWEPLYSYFTGYSTTGLVCGQYNYSGSASNKAAHYTTIRGYIDNKIPVQMMVNSWSSTSAHDINIWGYNTGSGTDYLYITDNQDSNTDYPATSLLNYASYSFRQYEVFGYSS